MTTLTATAATNGDPIASIPQMTSKTPHKIDNVEVCRTTFGPVLCTIESSSISKSRPIVLQFSLSTRSRSCPNRESIGSGGQDGTLQAAAVAWQVRNQRFLLENCFLS